MEKEGIYKEPIYGFDERTLNNLFSEASPLKKAGKDKRLINYIVDTSIMNIIFFCFFMTMGGMLDYYEGINGSIVLTTPQDLTILALFLMSLSTYFVYYIFCEYFLNGKTIGKMITGTKVVTKEGSKLSLANVIGRTLLRYLPFEIFSFLGSGTDGWHDSISHTIVIEDR
jgi:uncharacterized RDD family membrane protein YckC